MSTTYIPATWVAYLAANLIIIIVYLAFYIRSLRKWIGRSLKMLEQCKASIGVNQRNVEALKAAVLNREAKVQKLVEAQVRHIAQIEVAETSLVKEIGKQKALRHEIETLRAEIAEYRSFTSR